MSITVRFGWPIGLAVARLILFFLLYFNQSTDAQWQLIYTPIYLLDFPISLIYVLARVPFPYAEAILGPTWWFCVPFLVRHLRNSPSIQRLRGR